VQQGAGTHRAHRFPTTKGADTVITKQTIYFTMVHHPTRGKIRAGNACTKEGIPKFYTARTKRAVNSGGAL